MKNYGMSISDILTLPLRRFWFLANQVDRIRAEEDLRLLQVLASSQSAEGYEKAVDSLREQMGQVYVWQPREMTLEVNVDKVERDPEFDRAGLQRLKAMVRKSNP